MTKERIAEHREAATSADLVSAERLAECLDDIERLHAADSLRMKEYNILVAENRKLSSENGLLGDSKRVCELIGSIYYYGHFVAETANERELEALLRKLGYFFESEDQLMAKLHENPAPATQ